MDAASRVCSRPGRLHTVQKLSVLHSHLWQSCRAASLWLCPPGQLSCAERRELRFSISGFALPEIAKNCYTKNKKIKKDFCTDKVELCFAVHYESPSGRARELVAREAGAQKARARNRNRADTREADGRHQSGPLRGWRSPGVHELDPASAVWPRRHRLAQRLQGTGGRYRSSRRPSICRFRQAVSLLS
mgnify:CR=1 FL=1